MYWQFRYGWNWPAPVALILVLLILAPLVGALLYVGIMRGLRNTAEVTKIVVTVSVMLGIIALAQWIWSPTTPRNDIPFFGESAKFKFLGVYVTDHEVIALGRRCSSAWACATCFSGPAPAWPCGPSSTTRHCSS